MARNFSVLVTPGAPDSVFETDTLHDSGDSTRHVDLPPKRNVPKLVGEETKITAEPSAKETQDIIDVDGILDEVKRMRQNSMTLADVLFLVLGLMCLAPVYVLAAIGVCWLLLLR